MKLCKSMPCLCLQLPEICTAGAEGASACSEPGVGSDGPLSPKHLPPALLQILPQLLIWPGSTQLLISETSIKCCFWKSECKDWKVDFFKGKSEHKVLWARLLLSLEYCGKYGVTNLADSPAQVLAHCWMYFSKLMMIGHPLLSTGQPLWKNGQRCLRTGRLCSQVAVWKWNWVWPSALLMLSSCVTSQPNSFQCNLLFG